MAVNGSYKIPETNEFKSEFCERPRDIKYADAIEKLRRRKKKEKIFLLLTYSIKGDTIKLYISIAFYLSIIIER